MLRNPAAAAVARLAKPKVPKDHFERLFAFQCRALRLPEFRPEYTFGKEAFNRNWRCDFYFPDYKVAVEIEGLVMRQIGGEWMASGRHASPKGMKADMEKYNHAGLLGITVLRYEQGAVKSGEAVEFTQRVLCARGWKGPT